MASHQSLPPPVASLGGGGQLPSPPILGQQTGRELEDYLSGYPRFAALLGLHPSFHVFRNFSNLRVRLLLSKQDELAQLEERLERLDADKTFTFFRGSLRGDRNGERAQLMAEINRCLTEYDSVLERVEKSLKRHAAGDRDTENIQNWIQSTGQLPRSEAAYLWQDDLVAVGAADRDFTSPVLQGLIEDSVVWLSKLVKWTPLHQKVSRDSHIHIISTSVLNGILRFIITLLLMAMLFVPVVISVSIANTAARIGIAMIACCIFILALAMVAKAKTSELFVAGATYSAILVVFISGSH
ncbi:hypothetical protein F5Y13DRAFT_13048 [Hypoxylon sp. FL1857]|nr:hypothetical protein F5Y13DRAFT_13048 [Hypoxylon sp. FL1857]